MPWRVLLGLIIWLYSVPVHALTFGAAGVPLGLGSARDYDRIFSELAASDITVFFPTFQYVEAPAPKTLGYETDFTPPCNPASPAFAAMKRHGVRMIVPASLIYAVSTRFPSAAQDPLLQLIDCAGRDGIYGVLSYDEPAHNQISPKVTQALYAHVRQVAPDTPVLMVHAPLVIEPGRHDSPGARASYLQVVKQHSIYADIVGFSIYPIPPMVAKLGSPLRGDAIVDHVTAARDYLAWLAAEVPRARRMAVLQNFSYSDQYSDALLATVSPELRALVNAPTETELEAMVAASLAGGAELIIWYGAAFTKAANAASWRATRAVSKKMGR